MRPRTAAALAVAALAGCAQPATPVPVRIEIGHTLGGSPLQLDRTVPDGRTVSRLAYYFGGVRLRDRGGRWVAAREDGADLELVDARATDSLSFEALRVAPSAYDTLEFRIGVPALLADGTARTGPLDPARGMFWTWKAGYVFFALEGRSPVSPVTDHAVMWHAGGESALVRTVVLPLAGFSVAASSAPVIHLDGDLDALFDSLDAGERPTVMEPAQSAPVLDAVAAMFRVDHVHVDAGTVAALPRVEDAVPIGASL